MGILTAFLSPTQARDVVTARLDQLPDDFDLGGIVTSDSGEKMGHVRALRYSPVWRGVRLISEDVAKLPLYIYRRTDNGQNKQYDESHPAYQLLRYKPCPELKAFDFKRAVTKNAILEGNGLAFILRSNGGDPLELWPLDPGTSSPCRVNGELWYYTQAGDGYRWLRPDQVLHIRGLGWDGLSGYALWDVARNCFGLGVAGEKFANKYFSNSAYPGFVLEHPKTLSDKAVQNLRESFDEKHRGLDRSHRPGVLMEGMKATVLGNNARDAQLLELRQYQIREAANFLGLPPHKLGDTTRTAYASIEQENLAYLSESLDPWLIQWEEECRDKLFTEEQKRSESHVVEFMRLAMLKADAAARSAFYHNAKQDGWMNDDEIRARENMGPMPGGIGQIYYRPLNMVPAGKEDDEKRDEFVRQIVQAFIADGAISNMIVGAIDIPALVEESGLPTTGDYTEPVYPQDKPEEPPQGDPQVMGPMEASADVLAEALTRMIRRLGVHATKAAKKDFAGWLSNRMAAEHWPTIVETLRAPCRALGATSRVVVSAALVADELLTGIARWAKAAKDARDVAVVFGWAERNLPRMIVAQLKKAKQ